MARTTVLFLLVTFWIVSFASSSEAVRFGAAINGAGARKLMEESDGASDSEAMRRRREGVPPSPKANSNIPGPFVANNHLH
ncbi:hypothetical protein SUGI_0754090 [Cryptomeria japonica]|nr:hypothetical protein SUGI_0754090 [Cryptomeria japonica]